MELEIKQNTEDKVITVKFKNEKLIISENTDSWNNEGISKFLTNLAIHTPDGEAIEVLFDADNQDDLYRHIHSLFKTFVDEYNTQKLTQ